MLFIFRKLRRSFFPLRQGSEGRVLPGKVRTYMAYAAGEIVLIVVGILLALQISEWNQDRNDRADETDILVSLKAEFEENQERLKNTKDSWRTIEESMGSLLELTKPEPSLAADEAIHRFMSDRHLTAGYDPNTSVLSSLVSSGKIVLIENTLISNHLNAWTTELEHFHRRVARDETQKDIYSAYLIEHYQFRDSALTASFAKDNWGSSNFPYDQRALLSEPVLESAAANKRLMAALLLSNISTLEGIQQSILDLIDAELQERGIE